MADTEAWETLDEDCNAVRSAADAAEMLQDRLEALTSILEVQNRRVSNQFYDT
jgi:hypothetical protein